MRYEVIVTLVLVNELFNYWFVFVQMQMLLSGNRLM